LAPDNASAQNLYSNWDTMKNTSSVNILTEVYNLEQ